MKLKNLALFAAFLAIILITASSPCTAARQLTLSQPNGGQWFEPGETVQITWTPSGDSWLSTDTIKLDYSIDGTTWTRIQGATRLPYNQGSFSWNTGHIGSPSCSVRVSWTTDETVCDTSDSTFIIATDNNLPVITHYAVPYTGDINGPYRISAVVTDNRGVGQVTLLWRRNGGVWATVPMTLTGTADTYAGDIPGPAAVGDGFDYYIHAVDTSAQLNSYNSPANAPTKTHSFAVGGSGTTTIGTVSNGTTFAQHVSRGNFYHCTSEHMLTQIEHYMQIDTSVDLTYFVYQCDTLSGVFNKIYETTIPASGTGTRYFSSGPISVRLLPGNYYIIGAGSSGMPGFQGSFEHGTVTAFGNHIGSYNNSTWPPPSYAWYSDYNTSYRQRLTTTRVPGTLTITSPNGGQWYEPGDPVRINWSRAGTNWQSMDTLKLEYTLGTTWLPIPGASNLPYTTDSYTWDTSGLPAGSTYKVRVSLAWDPLLTDTSDANFTIAHDSIGPVITHTPLPDTEDTAGPYQVKATVTDNQGLATVSLFYSRNGSAYQQVPMTATGVSNQYAGSIPGSSLADDVISYYISATDVSGAGNTSTSPADAPQSVYSFRILTPAKIDVVAAGGSVTPYPTYTFGNIYHCTVSSTLLTIESGLRTYSAMDLHFAVYESATELGTYTKTLDKLVANDPAGFGYHSSGAISVHLTAGRYYILAVSAQFCADPQWTGGHPFATSFGNSVAGFSYGAYPPAETAVNAKAGAALTQRLTTRPDARSMLVTLPNGGETIENGLPTNIKWVAGGYRFRPGDTVSLSSSTDGLNWTAIPGAESLPYNAGTFTWSTLGLPDSETYSVRAVYNGDAAVSDTSDGTFALRSHLVPPMIVHTPLTDTPNVTGPYGVTATVTDDHGVAAVTLHWRRNDGEYAAIAMTSTGSGGYTAAIPGPTVPGDKISYYIEAKDASVTGNTGVSPEGAPESSYSFSILTCGVDQIGTKGTAVTGPSCIANNFLCTTGSRLTQFEQYLNITSPVELRFFLLESTSQSGPFTKIHETVVASPGTGEGWYNSGPISVVMVPGRYYSVGACWTNNVTFYQSTSTAWPTLFSSTAKPYASSYYPPYPLSITPYTGSNLFYQRLSTCRPTSAVGLQTPNCGEWFEPGAAVPVSIAATGFAWPAESTLRLEYSSDSGATWNQVAGAESLPAESQTFNWDTTGREPSEHYRLRVTCNQDSTLTDTSDRDFIIQTDTIPPTLTHTPRGNSAYTHSGNLYANSTDNLGIREVRAYWSINGGVFSSVSLTQAGKLDVYSTSSFGGSAKTGDVVRYYIEATDSSAAANKTRLPEIGYYEYDIIDAFTEAFSYDCENNPVDLDYTQVTFTPDGSKSFYSACTTPILSLPTDPSGGTIVTVPTDRSVQVVLAGTDQVSLYGQSSSTFFINADGTVSLGSGDTLQNVDIPTHFSKKRISALFTSLTPSTGGNISWKQLADRVAVTYDNVPAAYAPVSTFQIEMFFDGRIRLSYLQIDVDAQPAAKWGYPPVIAGLSEGIQYPVDRGLESNLSEYAACCPASVQVSDGVLPAQDLNIPFGTVLAGDGRSARVTVQNTGACDVILSGIRPAFYAEDFYDGLAQGWEESVDQVWNVTSGVYNYYSQGGTGAATYAGTDFCDFRYEAQLVEGTYGFGGQNIIFRASPGFKFGAGSNGYTFGFDGRDYLIASCYVNGTRIQLASWAPPIGTWYGPIVKLAVSAVGSTLKYYVNDQLLGTVTDSRLQSGRIGLGVTDGYYYGTFDDVVVSDPAGSAGAFRVQNAPSLPAQLAPGQSLAFDVVYAPAAAVPSQALLLINRRGNDAVPITLNLTGTGTPNAPLQPLKGMAPGAGIATIGRHVTAVFPDRFYVEQADRSCGIGVLSSGTSPLVGDVVSVNGYMTKANGERLIQSSGWTLGYHDSPLAPVLMTIKTLGGSDLNYDPATPLVGQQGITGSGGPNNIGLLVRTNGVVTSIDSTRFSLSDGSGASVTVAVPAGVAVPAAGSRAAVTGISSCEVDGQGALTRLLRVRSADDIQIFGQ